MKTPRLASWGRILCLVILFLLLSFSITAQETARTAPRIAVLDFEVQTENPSYKYLGKGFAEFIAVELSGIKGVTIVDRERRNAIMEEQKFALSGAADEAGNVELGKLLSANYLLSGSLFDMFGQLEVTIRLVDVEKGTAALSAQVGGEPKLYKQIVAELAGKVASSLNIVEAPIKVAAAAKPLNNTEADQVLTAFSKAVEAVDNNDIETAKASLKTAQKIDKENKAVTFYLNKLFSASPKFNVELIFYSPSYNPASLGFIDKDRLYLTFSTNVLTPNNVYAPTDEKSGYNWLLESDPYLYYSYTLIKGEAGYYFPIGERAGLGIELFDAGVSSTVLGDYEDIFAFRYVTTEPFDLGGRLSAGFRLGDHIGIGLSGSLFLHSNNLGRGMNDKLSNFNGAVTAGLYFQFLKGNLIMDTHASGTFIQEVYVDTRIEDYIAYKTAPYPVAIETSILGKLFGGRLNLSLKNILELYFSFGTDDRTGVATRIIPAAEWWPVDFFSIRAGGEYDLLSLNSMTSPIGGFGALGGLTFRIGPVDIDANFTYLQRVIRFYPGYIKPDTSLLVQVSWNGAFIKERKQ